MLATAIKVAKRGEGIDYSKYMSKSKKENTTPWMQGTGMSYLMSDFLFNHILTKTQ